MYTSEIIMHVIKCKGIYNHNHNKTMKYICIVMYQLMRNIFHKLFDFISAKPKSPKRSQERVTFTSRYPTITEKIDEEEKEAEEIRKQPVSPLTYLYDGVTIKTQSWPEFLGNWAFLAATGIVKRT